ncbi:MAG: LysR substrate-binding domain-containing protein [Actinomycetota bacterium]
MITLDVESLRTFLAVLDAGGMTSAARRLGVSQSAVSWKMKRLESRVGRSLLIRDGHEFRPTRDGRALLDDARSIVELHDRAAARLATSDLVGTVRVGSNEEVDPAQMADLLGRFRRAHPGATIEFLVDHTELLESAIDTGEIDVALIQVLDEQLRPDDALVWSDRLRWLTSAECEHGDEPVPLVTFGEHCFYRAVSEPLLAAASIEHRVAFSASSIGGVRSAIRSGLGVGVLGERYLGDDLVSWRPGDELPSLPHVHQVVRTVPGETEAMAQMLVDAIGAELLGEAA